MRITIKLTAAITTGMLFLLAADAAMRVRREDELLRRDMEQDARLVARALALAAEHAWQRQGPVAAEELVSEVRMPRDHLSARWVWLDAPAGDPHAPAVPIQTARLARGAVVVPTEEAVLAYARVVAPDGPATAVEIREPLDAVHAYERSTELRAASIAAGLTLLSLLVAAVVGARLVGGPVARLVALARRVGAGDLSGRVEGLPHDELGQLGSELNLMCDRLADARRRVEDEERARRAATEQLRHSDRLATAGRLAAGLAHELGTPLNVVAGRAGLISKEPSASPAVRDHARRVEEQAARMTAIINNLLEFTRRRPGPKVEQDLRPVARRALDLIRDLADRSGARLLMDAPEEAVKARIDHTQLEQVLTNLLVNAVQAMPGGGTARLSLGTGLRASPGGASGERPVVRLAVRDEGMGIPEEHQERLFEPFFTTKEPGEGTGLGLSVSHGIVADHGGWIEVESQPGLGSTFAVYLPRSEAAR